MDAVSLALAFPGFINDGIELGHRFQASKAFRMETSHASTLLKSNITRLQLWEESVGIKDGHLSDDHNVRLDNPQILSSVRNNLESIQELREKIENVFSRMKIDDQTKQCSLELQSVGPKYAKPRSSLPSRNGIKWGFSRAKTISDDLQSLDKHVEKLHQLVPPKIQKDLEKSFVESQLKTLQSHFCKEITRVQINDIDEWLQLDLLDQQYDTHRDARLNGTCDWIFNHPAYLSWDSDQNNASFLWICGPAGSGKTVLCARIIQKQKETSSQSSQIAYCFCSAYVQAGTKLEAIIRTFISQLVHQNPSMSDQLWNFIQSIDSERGIVASQADSWTVLKALLAGTPGCTLVIDGLDEFDRPSRVQSEFLRKVKNAVANTATKVLITSRDEGDIREQLSGGAAEIQTITLLECVVSKSVVRDDLQLLATKLIQDRLPRKPNDLKHDLSTRLAERSDGMFLWIKQQDLLQLRGSKNATQLRQIVDKMPKGLIDTYTRNWRDIQSREEDDRERTVSMLRWIAFSFRPLAVMELIEVLLVRADFAGLCREEWPDEIKGLCGSLVDIRASDKGDPGSWTLHLVHASVKEFLLTALDSDVAEQHAEMAKTCLRYMNFREVWEHHLIPREDQTRYAFLDYATAMWNKHYEATNRKDSNLLALVNDLFEPKTPNFSSFREHFIDFDATGPEGEKTWRKAQAGNPLWFSAHFNLPSAARRLVIHHPELLNMPEPCELTALHKACGFGHTEIASLLLESGAEAERQANGFPPAVMSAAYDGHKDTVSCLISHGVNLEAQDSLRRTALLCACENEHIEVAHLLLDHGARPMVVCTEGTTPLYWACQYGNPGLVLRLVDGSKELIKLPTFSGITPLTASVSQGNLEVTKILLENGAEASLEFTSQGITPLFFAVWKGDPDMVRLLLKHGADPRFVTESGKSVLYQAARGGSSEVVKILLDLGVDSTSHSVERERCPLTAAVANGHLEACRTLLSRMDNFPLSNVSLLHLAAENGHGDISALLLDHKADIKATDANGDTALHLAAFHGFGDVVEMLLDRGADWKALNNHLVAPLDFATAAGLASAVERLLDLGADLDRTDWSGTSPLVRAVSGGHMEVVKILLDRGANPTARKEGGWQAVHTAAHFGHTGVIEYLARFGISLDDAENDNRETPLLAASQGKCPDTVRFLLNHGVDVSPRDRWKWTPLHNAVNKNDQQTVQCLLDYGADINAQTDIGWTPLHWAAGRGHFEIAECLLLHGADPTIHGSGNWTALHAAVQCGACRLVKCLVDHGADIQVQSTEQMTLLNLAVYCGRVDMVKFLFEYDVQPQLSISSKLGYTPLHFAAGGGQLKIVEILLAQGADPAFGGAIKMTPLFFAASGDRMDIVQLLLDTGEDLSTLCGDSWSPFNNAALGGHLETLKLIAVGHPLTSFKRDCEGRTALHLAALGGQLTVFNFLLDAGLDPQTRDYHGRSILDFAAASESLDMVERVLQLPEPVSFVNEQSNWTSFHWAARSSSPKIIKTLISAGLEECSAKTDSPFLQATWTPWAVAKFCNNHSLLEEPDSPLKLHDEPSDLVPGTEHSGYSCDSCEWVERDCTQDMIYSA